MLGKYLETFFNRCYLFIKLSLIFWCLSFSGGLIFGVGPAFVTISTLFLEFRWEYKEMNKATWWKIYKENFKKGNFLFYIFGAISGFLAYNLYLSVQISGLLFLMIDFLIIFVLVILSIAFWFSILIQSQYDCSIKDTFKLSAILSFMSFKNMLVLTIGGLVVIMITYKFPGLILFGSIGFWTIFVANVSQPLFTKLDEQLVVVEN